jgi:hypothetical protein
MVYPLIITQENTANYALGQSVEWIVERVELSDDGGDEEGYFDLTNFGTAAFTNCAAETSDGESQTLSGADTITMVRSFDDEVTLAYGEVVDDNTAGFTWQAASRSTHT